MLESVVEVTCPECDSTHAVDRSDARVRCGCGVELAVTVTRIK